MPIGQECCGYLVASHPWIPRGLTPVDTSWPHTREVSLGPKAEQDRQKPSNWCLVNVRLQFTTQCLPCPRHCGLSGRGSFYIRPTWCSPSPARSVILRECHEINLTSSFMVFRGSWFYKSFPSSEEDLEDPLLPLSFAELSFKKIFCFSSSGRQGCLVYPEALQTSRYP